MLEQTKRLGAVVALVFYSSALLVFVFRLLGYPQVGNWIGYGELLVDIPFNTFKTLHLSSPDPTWLVSVWMIIVCYARAWNWAS